VPLSEGMFSRKYVFTLKSFTYEITFAAKSKEDYEGWMSALSMLQKETDQKKKDLLKKKGVTPIEKGNQKSLNQAEKER
jgi:hypothetical protein